LGDCEEGKVLYNVTEVRASGGTEGAGGGCNNRKDGGKKNSMGEFLPLASWEANEVENGK